MRTNKKIKQPSCKRSSLYSRSPELSPAYIRSVGLPPSPSSPPVSPIHNISDEHAKNLQRMHLVIDLDATFISTYTDFVTYNRMLNVLKTLPKSVSAEILDRIFIFSIGKDRMWTIVRHGAKEFMEFASLYFKSISVWSAGRKPYVDQIVSFLFPPHIPKPGSVFSWDDCRVEEENEDGEIEVTTGKAASPSNNEFLPFTKPLEYILSHRITSGDSLENTLILDDRRDIAECNIDNLIHIPPFEPRLTAVGLSAQDHALEQLTDWLMKPEVSACKDIRDIDKNHIFYKAD